MKSAFTSFMRLTCLFIVALLSIGFVSTAAFAQATGDYGSLGTGIWGTTGANWLVCVTPGGWGDATPAAIPPPSTANVWIRAGHTVTLEVSAKTCNNLTVENTGSLVGANTLPTSSLRYLRVYGSTITNNGNIGTPTDCMGFQLYNGATQVVTITGTGTTYFSRIQPMTAGEAVIIDANVQLDYAGSSGTGSTALYCANGDFTVTINAGKTVTMARFAYVSAHTSSATTAGNANFTINLYGTLTTGNQAHINLNNTTGKTSLLTVYNGGTLNLGDSANIRADVAGPTYTINVNNGGAINGGNDPFGQFVLSQATTTVDGTIDFKGTSTSSRSIGTAAVSSTGKLRFEDGTYPSGSITLNSGSTVEYYGTSPITLGASPTAYANLLMNNAAGVTLGASPTVSGTLTMTAGNITTGANTLTMGGGGGGIVGASASSYIDGKLAQVYSAPGSLAFPIGKGGNYRPMTFNYTALDLPSTVTAEQFETGYPGVPPSPVTEVGTRYWTVTQTGAGVYSYNITLDPTGLSFVGGPRILKNDGATCVALATTTPNYTATGLTTLSDFAFGQNPPAIVETGTLVDFGSVYVGASSTPQTFTVAGTDLTANLVVTAPANFQVSTSSGSGYGASVSLTPVSGTVTTTTIYARFSPLSVGAASGNIACTSTGATEQDVAVTGTGAAISSFPLTEGFENVTFPPVNWSSVILNGSYNWDRVTAGSNPTQLPYSGVGEARFQAYNAAAPANARLLTPGLQVPGSGLQVIFQMYHDNGYSTTPDSLTVDVSTNGGGAWTSLAKFLRYNATNGWQSHLVNLTGYTGVVNVGFHAWSRYGNNMFIDSVIVQQIPLIPPTPAGNVSPLDAATLVLPSATLNWSAPTGGGSVTGYKLYFGTDGGGVTPPTNVVNGTNLGNVLTYDPTPDMPYSTTFYWQVVPTGPGGDATSCPIWSFTTGPNPTITTFPYAEGFEGLTFAPYGWSNTGSVLWNRSTGNAYAGAADAHISYGHTGNSILMSPPINLPAAYRISWWWKDADASLALAKGGNNEKGAVKMSPYVAGHDTTFFEVSIDGGTSWLTLDTLSAPAPQTSWNQVIQNLSPYASSNFFFRFRDFSDGLGAAYGSGVDSIRIEAIPSCPTPTALTATGITATSANIGWTPGGTETAWEYVYGVSPVPPPSGSGTATTSNPTALSGLTASTAYQFYVRSNCGSSFSAWVGPYSFATPCGPVTVFPYTQSFSSTLGCWSASEAVAGASYHWTPTTGDASHGAGTPQSGTYFAYLYAYLAQSTYNPYYLNTPTIILDATAKRVRYYYWLGAEGYQTTPVPLTLQITTNGGTTWTDLYAHTSSNSVFGTVSTSPWTQNTVSLSAYTGMTVQMRFASNSNYGNGYCDQGIDEFTIEDIPSGPPDPAVIASPANGANGVPITATLNWLAAGSGGPVTGYKFYYGTDNPPTNIVNGTNLGNVLTYDPTPDMLYSTLYYWQVVPTGPGGDAAGCPIWSFTSAPNPFVSTFPWIEGFDNTTFPPANWVRTGPAALWARLTTPVQPNGIVGPAARANFYDVSSGLDTIKTPFFELNGMSNMALKFNHAYRQFSSETDELIVIASADEGATWTQVLFDKAGADLATLPPSTTQFVPAAAGDWTTDIILIPNAFLVDGARFAFVANTNFGNDLWLDNVEILQLPTVDYTMQSLVQIAGIPTPFRPVSITGNRASRSLTPAQKMSMAQTMVRLSSSGTSQEPSVRNSKILTNYKKTSNGKVEVRGLEPVNIRSDARGGDNGNTIDGLSSLNGYTIVTNSGVTSPAYQVDWNLQGAPQTSVLRPSGIPFLGRDSVYLSTTPLNRGTITMDATANVPGDANPGDNTQVNNRVYVYPSPNVRIKYDNGANIPDTYIGFGDGITPMTAGVRYTATQDMHIANVDGFYRNEASIDSILVQVWAAGTTTSAPGAVLYSKKFAGVNYISASGDYFSLPLGDDAPTIAGGSDFWLSIGFPGAVTFPMGAHNSGFTTGHSFGSGDGGATWFPLVITTERAWLLRAVGVPIPDTTAPVITYAPLSSTTSGGSIVLSATITDNKSVDSSVAGAPRLWYRSGPTIPLSGSYSSVSGARASAGSTTWNFTLPALSSITFVEYYVAVQDNALNVVTEPAGTGYTSSPPNGVVTTPNRFAVASPLTFTVGTAGANFPSITEGLTWFNGGIDGPLQFLLNSDYTSVGEVYPIFIGSIPGLGTFADAVNASGRHQTGTKNTIAPNRMTGPEVATVNALPAFRPRIATMAMKARRIPGLGKSGRNTLITNTFTIKPNTGATPGPISGTAPFSTTFAIIWIDAANGVTIDGLTLANAGDGPTVFISDGASHNRIINSTIKGVTQAGNAVGNIWFTDNVLPVNCTDNVIANCTLTDNGGGRPYAGAIFFSTAPVTDVNDTIRNCTIQNFGPANASGGEGIWAISSTTGLVIENNDFSFTTPGPGFAAASYAGIFVGSSATGLVTGTIVRNNTIHDIDVVTPSGLIAGISLGSGANVDGALAEGNTIINLAATGQATGSGVRGFYVAGGLNQVITRNTIKDLQNNIAGGAVLGLRISGAAGGQAFKTTWTNNMIVLGNVGTNGNTGYLGISDNGNTDDTTIVAFNSIYIGGASTGGTTACYNRSAPSVATVENNIFMSERSGGVKNYGIRSTPATGGIFSSDYNDIYVTGATNGVFGAFAGVDQATLAAWQTASAGDVHSLNVDPVFVDAISAEDLHIRTFVGDLSPVANVGVPYGGVTVDIDNEAGHRTTTPDIGADEFNMRAPVAFNMLTPVNGATEQPLAGSLTWDPTVGATVYDIFLDTNPAPVTLLAGNVAGTTTPYTGLATDLTYRWKVVAKNSDSSTTATGAPFHFATLVSTVNVSVPLGLGWNMIANPVTVTNDTVQHLYPTSAFNFAYFFVPSGPGAGYVKDTTMENGTGYWGKFPAAVAQTVSGLPRTRDSISVVAGWNMVGTISNPVDTSTIVSVPPGLKATHWYGFTPTGPTAGYNPATPLTPGLAYWIKANGAGKFVLANPVVTKPAKGQASGVDVKDVLNSLTITDSRGHAQTLYFGADASNQVPVAMYAMPPAPPIGVLDARFATADGGSMVRTHAVKVSEALEFPVTIQSDAYPLTISWNVSKGTASYEMTDGAGGHVFLAKEMKGEGSMKITNTDLSRVSVRLVGDGTLPTEYALSQNYPNPFNPTTNIKYALPVQSKVMAEVYNLLGQRVRTLVNDDQPAGYHLVAWDGTGNGNEHLASGTYFLRLSATGTNGKTFTEVRKLLMLK